MFCVLKGFLSVTQATLFQRYTAPSGSDFPVSFLSTGTTVDQENCSIRTCDTFIQGTVFLDKARAESVFHKVLF